MAFYKPIKVEDASDDEVIYLGTKYIKPEPLAEKPISPVAPVANADEGEEFKCIITGDLMHNPVHAADGFVYEYEGIMGWFNHEDNATKHRIKSPRTNLPMSKHLFRVFEYYTRYKAWCVKTENPLPSATTDFGLIYDSMAAAVMAPQQPQVQPHQQAPPRVANHAPLHPMPPLNIQPRQRTSFVVHCSDIPNNFVLSSTMAIVPILFGQYRTDRCHTFMHVFGKLTKQHLISLLPQNLPSLNSRSKAWLLNFIYMNIRAFVANGRTELSGRGKYTYLFQGPGEAYIVCLVLPIDYAYHMEERTDGGSTSLDARLKRLSSDDLVHIADWNGCDPFRISVHRNKNTRIEELCDYILTELAVNVL